MKKIKDFVNDYLKPKEKVFIINQPKEKVCSAIENIRNSSSIFGDLDFILKECTGDYFLISLKRFGRTPYPSVVIGQISTNDKMQVVIKCRRRPRLLDKVFITIIIASGGVYLWRFLFGYSDFRNLASSFLCFVILPWLAMWYSMMTETVLYERFEVYLRKTLNKSNFPAAKNEK